VPHCGSPLPRFRPMLLPLHGHSNSHSQQDDSDSEVEYRCLLDSTAELGSTLCRLGAWRRAKSLPATRDEKAAAQDNEGPVRSPARRAYGRHLPGRHHHRSFQKQPPSPHYGCEMTPSFRKCNAKMDGSRIEASGPHRFHSHPLCR